MCDLSRGIERRAEERGRAEGRVEGLIRMCSKLNMSPEGIANNLVDVLGMSPADVQKAVQMYA